MSWDFLLDSVLTWILIFQIVLILWNQRVMRRPQPCQWGEKAPLVSVLVPARDEERDVGDCLRSLLAQDYPGLRVVLADDGSTDRTREIAEGIAAGDPRLEVMSPGDPPEGWVGKPHALYRAWRHAKPDQGTLLLFTDADIVFEPGALGAAVAYALPLAGLFVAFRLLSLRHVERHFGSAPD